MDNRKIKYYEIEDLDTKDYPDFSDAYISYAEYEDRALTEEELEELNNDSDRRYDLIWNKIF